MSRPFDGKVTLVTGGSSGIGKVTAIKFAQQGAQVVIADIQSGEQTVAEIDEMDGEALFIKTDVSQAVEAEAVVWLCSDAASLVTGVAMPVDGGLLAGMW